MIINFLLPDHGYQPRGGFLIVYQYANLLSRRGHSVTITHTASVRKGIRVLFGILRQMRLKKNKKEWFAFDDSIQLRYINTLCEENIENADIIIATACETASFVNGYSKKKGKKIYFIQGFETWVGSKKMVLDTWQYPMKKIVISKDLYKIASDNKINDVTYVPNAIDLDKYKVIKAVNERQDVIAMMYSEDPLKGCKYGLGALVDLKRRHSSINVVLFGKEPRPKSIPGWIAYYENPEQKFLVEKIYNHAKYFICPSIYEGWGLPAMESMACGAVLITSDCGGIRDFAVDRHNALICEPKSTNGIMKCVEELLENEELARKLVTNALNDIKSFSWEESVEKFERVLID